MINFKDLAEVLEISLVWFFDSLLIEHLIDNESTDISECLIFSGSVHHVRHPDRMLLLLLPLLLLQLLLWETETDAPHRGGGARARVTR